MKCKLLSIYYTFRYGLKLFFTEGLILMGHNFEYTGETHHDHWELECTVCGEHAGSELSPEAVKKLEEAEEIE